MPLVTSISGLRATLKDSLLPNIISDYTAAFAELQGNGEIVVGRDGRPSGEWIEKIVVATLIAYGKKVRVIGVVPTPTVQLEVEHSAAAGGIAITASHNPDQWNGLKFLDKTGVFLNKTQNEKLWDIVRNKKYNYSDNIDIIKETYDKNAIYRHIESIFKNTVLKDTQIIEDIKKKKFKIVVDAVNASGSVIVPSLLEQLGCEVIKLHCDESGIFPHTPEPVPANLSGLSEAVRKHNADIGIAVDPDADRLVLIDENGEPIGEEKTIAIAARNAFRNSHLFEGYNNKAVVNLSTSKMIEDIADDFGFEVFRSPVGEINVVNLMKENNALIGGEGSGGVILPACHYGRDSLVGISLLLSELVQADMTMSELANDLPQYHMIKYKTEVQSDIKNKFSEIEQKYKEIKLVKTDGIRLDFENQWVHIRASNTEPIVRVITEAKTKEDAEQMAKIFLKMF